MGDVMQKVLDAFLKENFPGLELSPGLFYAWNSSIRFEISPPGLSSGEPEFLEQACHRASELFVNVFRSTEEILLAAVVQSPSNEPFLQRKHLNIYLKYIKRRQVLYKLQHFLLIGDNKGVKQHRFILPCRKNDIHYKPLLKAILFKDLAHPSAIMKNRPRNSYDIYIINHTRKMIYHLYDNRGCDILAADKEQLRPLYNEYRKWILEYDREKVDYLFK
jgi:hypothetical protein